MMCVCERERDRDRPVTSWDKGDLGKDESVKETERWSEVKGSLILMCLLQSWAITESKMTPAAFGILEYHGLVMKS